jgi:uncharacterized protein
MTFDLLIDGYNLMHFAGLARTKYGPGGFERARDRFLKLLQQGLTAEERACTTVVFDAQHAPYPNRTARHLRGMTVLFSPPGQEADDTIEELVRAHSAPRKLIVISSDRRLQRSAGLRKAAWIDADGFLEELDRRQAAERTEAAPAHAPPSARTDRELSAAELDEWLDVFGDLDVSEISSSVRRESTRDPRRSRKPPAPQTREPPKPEPPKPEPARPEPPASAEPEGRRRKKPKRRDPAPGPSPPKELPILPDEISFWERRIAELFDEGRSAPRDDG